MVVEAKLRERTAISLQRQDTDVYDKKVDYAKEISISSCGIHKELYTWIFEC